MKYMHIALPFLLLLNLGCKDPQALRYPLYIGDEVFSVEVADSPEEHRRGLMHRQSLAPDQGMLFVFPDSQLRSFWMRNTYIDLSIAYIDSDGIIVDILDMVALDETPVHSSRPVQYGLELNRGAFEGIYPGDRVDLREIPLP